MVQFTDTYPLAGFLQNHKAHLDRLAASGRPEVLTVDGEARVVVQDAAAYQKLIDALETAEAAHALRDRLAALDRGEPGVPAEQVLAEIRARLGVDPK